MIGGTDGDVQPLRVASYMNGTGMTCKTPTSYRIISSLNNKAYDKTNTRNSRKDYNEV